MILNFSISIAIIIMWSVVIIFLGKKLNELYKIKAEKLNYEN